MSTEASTGGAPASTGEVSSTADISSTGDAFTWGDGWRNQLAAGSTDLDKELKQLERFEAPDQIYKSWRELNSKITSGEMRTKLADEPSEKELAQWRKDNAIPATPEDYAITMPEGRDPPADDDAFLKAMLKSMHDTNSSQAQVDATITTFYAEVDRQQDAVAEVEKKAEAATEDQLRKDWGEDYRVNKSIAEANLARAPEGFRDRFMNGYMEDGTLIRADVDAWKWLVQNERDINPMATVVPGAQGDGGKAAAAELVELRALMKNDNSKYWKGEEAPQLQERYRELTDAASRLKAKQAG